MKNKYQEIAEILLNSIKDKNYKLHTIEREEDFKFIYWEIFVQKCTFGFFLEDKSNHLISSEPNINPFINEDDERFLIEIIKKDYEESLLSKK